MEYRYELTKDQFQWSVKNDIPRYEKRAESIKELMKIIKIEKEAGLQSFVSGDKKERVIDFFNGVLGILNYKNSGSGKFRTKKECISWLKKNSPKGGKESINEIRLSLLFTLGLIFENNKGIQLTGIGNQIRETESKVEFYKRLLGSFPEFELLESYLKWLASFH